MGLFRFLHLSIFTLLAVAVLFSVNARAQKVYNAPTEGIFLPSPSLTEVSDATAIATNPANIGFLDSWSFVYAAASSTKYSHLPGQGHGFFLAFPAGPLGFGVGTELLLPHEYIRDWQGLDKRGRLSLAMSLNPSKGLGLGIAYRRSMRYHTGDVMRSLDLSLSVRPINHLSVAFTYSDVNAPKVSYRPIEYQSVRMPARREDAPKRFVSALTVRPFGDDRVALGAELHYMHGDRKLYDLIDQNFTTDSFHRTDLHAIATVVLTDGISLRGRFVAEGIHTDDIPNEYYMDASISIDSARFPFGFLASPYFKLYPASHDGFEGMSMAVRFSGDTPRSIPLILAPAYIVPIEIERKMGTLEFGQLMEGMERIRLDKSVDMLLFKPKPGTIPLTLALGVRRELQAINRTGKKTLCYLEEADAGSYVACSAASQIWVNPAGGMHLSGLSTHMVYFKNLLDKIGVKAEVIQVGEYKSAPETFTQTGPTHPADKAMNRFMDSVYGAMVRAIQKDRGFRNMEDARKAIESGPFLADEAVQFKLADRAVGADELEAEFEKLFESPIYIAENYGRKPQRSQQYLDSPAVAVLHIEGDIKEGESVHLPFFGVNTVGSDTLKKQIRELKDDSRIRAVVVRINSPGGSALASDIIWRELMALRREKPVVVSMGSVAASGGYLLASAADVIFAESTSLTGSIGVYYGKADISGLLDKVGISTKTYARGAFSDMQSWIRPYTPEEREKLLKQVTKVYQNLKKHIAEGRGNRLSLAAVEKVGQGRIWSGSDAKLHNLVDRIGGYQDALNYTRVLAQVSSGTRVRHVPEPSRTMMTFIARQMGMAKAGNQNLLTLSKETRETLKAALPFALSNHASAQARLPFAIIETE
ncbi:MAG: signal peptide peptidase SppA [Deltaproteobacteria bacterium]|nr:signal peptide peptidase SppA [Deltaproteobacteria bacterium]